MPRHSNAQGQFTTAALRPFYTYGQPFYVATPTIGRFLRTKSVTTANGPLSSDWGLACCTLLTEMRCPTLLRPLRLLPAVVLTRWIHADRSATCPHACPQPRPHTIFHGEF